MLLRLCRLLFRLFLLCTPSLNAADPVTLVFDTLDNDTGLIQNTVNVVQQDSKGFLWFGTQGGLHRFDGYDLSVFQQASDPLLPESLISALIEDPFQRLWIGTSTRGLALFDVAHGQLRDLPAAQLNLEGEEAHVRCLSVDEQRLWVGHERGISVFQLSDFTKRDHRMGVVNACIGDGLGGLWVATRDHGLWQVTHTGETRQLMSWGPHLMSLWLDEQAILWIGSETGLGRLDTRTGATDTVVLGADAAQVSARGITSITGESSGHLWLGLKGQGLGSFHYDTGKFLQFKHHPSDPYSLPDDAVRVVFTDRSRVLWVGTSIRGLARVNLDAGRFRLFREHVSKQDETGRNNVRSILGDEQNRLWIGTDGAGLKRYTENGFVYEQAVFAPLIGERAASEMRILALQKTDAGSLFVGSEEGVFRFDPEKKRAELFNAFPAVNGQVETMVRALLYTDDQHLWVGGHHGVFRLNWADKKMDHIFQHGAGLAQKLTHNTVLAIHQHKSGDTWFGTLGGLNRFREGQPMQSFLHQAGDASSLPSNVVRVITTTRDGQLWVGTHSGLARLRDDDREASFESWGRKDGMADATIYGILEDEAGHLWLSSNHGLAKFERDSNRFTIFDRHDGLQGAEFNGGAYFRHQDGRLFFGGVNGYNAFFSSAIKPSDYAPPLWMTGVQIGQQEKTSQLGHVKQEVRADYAARIVSIQVAALDYSASSRLLYSFRLQGFDREWSKPGYRREAIYTNLDPGFYQLQVKAANRDGVWLSDTLTIPLRIVPPLWLTPMAKIAYVLAIVIVIAMVMHSRKVRSRERERADLVMRESEQRLKWALWGSGDGLWVWELDKNFIYREGIAELLGYREEENRSDSTWRERLIHPEDVDILPAALQRHLQGETEFFEATYRLRHKDGSWVWVQDRGKVVERRDDGRAVRIAGTMKDVTERRRHEDDLRHLANYDTLTGLPNRTLFHERLRHALAHARRAHYRVALLFFDLDRFKHINDSLGHSAGDALLKQVAKRVLGCIRDDDTAARLGGDEFTIVLEAVPTVEAAGMVADKLLASFRKPFELEGHEVSVTPSIGISTFPDDGDDAATLIKNADLAMYHAKEQGRNNYQFYVGAMNDQMRRRHALESALRKALEQNEFTLHYQPKLAIAGNYLTGLEALLRWHSADLGRVGPDEFIPLAEETGLIVAIGDWVLAEALRQQVRWRQAGVPIIPVAVNLSLRQLMSADLHTRIAELLLATELDAGFLQLEITESLVMANPDEAAMRLHRLRDMGLRLAVDDFGTGYSSLSYLRKLPIDTIKIDKSFVRDITVDADDATITSTIIAMAHSLKLSVVAEGVETQEQLTFLREGGCEEIQGYLLAKPLPAAECASFILQYHSMS